MDEPEHSVDLVAEMRLPVDALVALSNLHATERVGTAAPRDLGVLAREFVLEFGAGGRWQPVYHKQAVDGDVCAWHCLYTLAMSWALHCLLLDSSSSPSSQRFTCAICCLLAWLHRCP